MTILHDYLTLPPQGEHGNVWSCFAAGLRAARKASGRNEGTGAVDDQKEQESWVGAIAYLCLFDQLGSTVRVAVPDAALSARLAALRGDGPQRSFRATLCQFSDVDDQDSATLWALRNSLAHDFSLVNVPTNRNRVDLRHRFALVVGRNTLVTYPQVEWDGDFPGTGGDTVVDLVKLSEVGETVAERLLAANDAGDVACDLTDDELRTRYFLAVGGLSLVQP